METKDKTICDNNCRAFRVSVPDCNDCSTNCRAFKEVTPDYCYSCAVYIENRTSELDWEPSCYVPKVAN